jgi:lipoprotein-releasing system permease protein
MPFLQPAFAKHLSFFLCAKYLCRKKIVLLSIASVMMSAALLVVVSSLFSGFIAAIETTVVDHSGNIVMSASGIKIPQYDKLIAAIENDPAIESATATLTGYGGLLYLSKGNVRAVEIVGIEMPKRSDVMPFTEFLVVQSQSDQPPSFVVEGSDRLGAFAGIGILGQPDEKTDEYDTATLKEEFIGRTVGLTTVKGNNQKPTLIKFPIADIFFSGFHLRDSNTMYLPIEMLTQKLFPENKQKIADKIQIAVAAGTDPDQAVETVRRIWKSFASEQLNWSSYLSSRVKVATSSQKWAPIISEYRKQMNMLIVIFGIVSGGVVLLISCIFYLIVMTKQKDIAVAKSCGLGSSAVTMLFVSFGLLIGTVGSTLGVGLGYVVIRNINALERMITLTLGLKLWRSSTYMFTRIPSQMNWQWGACIFVIAILAAGIGAFIPAIMAARIRPVKILRYE